MLLALCGALAGGTPSVSGVSPSAAYPSEQLDISGRSFGCDCSWGLGGFYSSYVVSAEVSSSLGSHSFVQSQIGNPGSGTSLTLPSMGSISWSPSVPVDVSVRVENKNCSWWVSCSYAWSNWAFFELLPTPKPRPTIRSVSRSSGAIGGGTGCGPSGQVTVYGSNFYKTTEVYFGGQEVPSSEVTYVNPNELYVYPPSHSAGRVSVSASNGSNASTQDGSFTYEDPVVTSVTPNAGPWSGGTSVTVQGRYLCGSQLDVWFVPLGSSVSSSSPQGRSIGNVSETEVRLTTPSLPSPSNETTNVLVSEVAGSQTIYSSDSPSDEFSFLEVPTVTKMQHYQMSATEGLAWYVYGTNFAILQSSSSSTSFIPFVIKVNFCNGPDSCKPVSSYGGSFTVLGPSELEVNIPRNSSVPPGTYAVQVVTPGGSSNATS